MIGSNSNPESSFKNFSPASSTTAPLNERKKGIKQIWQEGNIITKVAIVVITPIVLIYHLAKDIVFPVTRWTYNKTISLAKKIFIHFPVYLYQQMTQVAINTFKWTYSAILKPIITSVKQAFNFIANKTKQLTTALGNLAHLTVKQLKELCAYLAKGLDRATRFIKSFIITLFQLPQLIYSHVLAPIGRGIKAVAVWTYNTFALPVINAAYKTFQAILAAATWLKNKVVATIDAVRKGITYVIKQIDKAIRSAIHAVVNGICQAAKAIFCKFPKLIYSHVLAPIGRSVKAVAIWTYRTFALPVINAACKTFQAILAAATWLKNKVVATIDAIKKGTMYVIKQIDKAIRSAIHAVVNGICQAAKAIFCKFPKLIYSHVLAPIGRSVKAVAIWTYRTFALPVIKAACKTFQAILAAATWLKNKVVATIDAVRRGTIYVIKQIDQAIRSAIHAVVNGICQAAKAIFCKFPKLIYSHVLAPIGRSVKAVAIWTYRTFALPVIKAACKTFQAILAAATWLKNKSLAAIDAIKRGTIYVIKQIDQAIRSAIHAVVNGICQAAKAIFCKFPKLIYSYVLAPIGRSVKAVAIWTYRTFALPVIKAACKTFQAIVAAATWLKNKVVATIDAIKRGTIYVIKQIDQAIRSAIHAVVNGICKAAKAIFCQFPKLIYSRVLAPIGRSIKAAISWSYKNFILPIKHIASQIALAVKNFFTEAYFAVKNSYFSLKQATKELMTRVHFNVSQTIVMPIKQSTKELFQTTIPAVFRSIRSTFSFAATTSN